MTDHAPVSQHYWQRHTDGRGRHWHRGAPPPGDELAALRRGLGREPGAVPQMWRFYTTLNADGHRTRALRAEHLALTLFALHQQSRAQPMHRDDVGVGTAMQALRNSGKFSVEAVNRRFAAAATASSPNELGMHLRGLVTQLRGIGQPLDYTRLFHDLRDYHYPERVSDVRRRWGAQYFVWKASPVDDGSGAEIGDTTASA